MLTEKKKTDLPAFSQDLFREVFFVGLVMKISKTQRHPLPPPVGPQRRTTEEELTATTLWEKRGDRSYSYFL